MRVFPLVFNGKEKDYESGFHYYGARYYWSEVLTSFLSVDRYADKYPSISPYAYCAWNPIRLTDPSGDTLRPAPGSSPEFVAYLNQAIQYLVDNGADGIYSQLQSNPSTVYVTETSFELASAGYVSTNTATRTIEWCPTAAAYTTEGVMLSPTTVLNHELDHMLQSILHPEQQAADALKEVFGYRNQEEVRVITGSEQTTARSLGEISGNQVTRRDHKGRVYEVVSPISTTLKNPSHILKKPQSPILDEVQIIGTRPQKTLNI